MEYYLDNDTTTFALWKICSERQPDAPQKPSCAPQFSLTFSSSHEDIFKYFSEYLFGSFKSFYKNPYPYTSAKWFETECHEILNYFYPEEEQKEFIFKHRIKYGYLPVKKNSINLFLNSYRCHNIFAEQFKDCAKKNGETSLIPLITACCLAERTVISGMAQFTYSGERYVLAKHALDTDNSNYEKAMKSPAGDTLAVPFRYADTLIDVDSARFAEKIAHVVNKEREHIKSEEQSINVKLAIFGSLTDKPLSGGKHHIETLADDGMFGKNVKVTITYFKLCNMDVSTVDFKEDNPDEEEALCGSIFDVDFLTKVCEKYQIACMLDMGCFYADTGRFSDPYGDTAFETFRNRMRSIIYLHDNNGADSVSIRAYESLYHAYIRWVENAIYSKNHSYEFDTRLYAALVALKPNIPFYTFTSHDRNDALANVRKYRNLCKGEYYNGVSVDVYNWSYNTLNEDTQPDECERRYNEILSTSQAAKDKVIHTRAWKIIKSLCAILYSSKLIDCNANIKEFINSAPSSDSENGEEGKTFSAFIRCAYNVDVLFDYSKLNKRDPQIEYSYRLVNRNSINDINDKDRKRFLGIIDRIISATVSLAFDNDSYEECSSDYAKDVILNAICADSKRIEHLLVANLLQNQYQQYQKKCAVQFIKQEPVRYTNQDSEENFDYKKHDLHQRDMLSLYDAICYINNTSQRKYEFAAEKIQEYFLNDNDGSKMSCIFEKPCNNCRRPDCKKILDSMAKGCENIGFTNCALYTCATQNS